MEGIFTAGEFSVLCWIACLFCTGWIIFLITFQKHLLIKPSIILLILTNVFFQWPLAYKAPIYYKFLIDPLAPLIITFFYVVFGLMISTQTFKKTSVVCWNRLSLPYKTDNAVIYLLFAIVLFVFAYYLTVVPLQDTGLYNIIYNPSLSDLAREHSYKLLGDVRLAYLLAFSIGAIAPLLAAMLSLKLSKFFREKNIPKCLMVIVVFLFICFLVSLPGARAPAGTLILVAFMVQFYKKQFNVGVIPFLIFFIMLLSPVVLMTVLREGKGLDFLATIGHLPDYLAHGVLRRFLVTPLETGIWHIDYVQKNNAYFGVTGIPKLASLFGLEGKNVTNLIGRLYILDSSYTSFANTGYIFSYFSYFGYWSIPLTTFGLLILDFILYVYMKLNRTMLLPTVAVTFLTTSTFTMTSYTIVLLSGGFVLTLVVGLIFTAFMRKNLWQDVDIKLGSHI